MAVKHNASPREGLTFDDVLIKPGLSEVLPADVDIRSHITRSIAVNIPIIASAMDTVTEAQMAIAMAQAGGIGVVHRNMEPEEQAAQVRQVKKFESGMVVNPLTIEPGATLQQALDLMKDNHISGIPVVESGGNGQPGKLVDHQLGDHCDFRWRLSSAAMRSVVKALGWPSCGMSRRDTSYALVTLSTEISGMPSLRRRSSTPTSMVWANSDSPCAGPDVSSGQE